MSGGSIFKTNAGNYRVVIRRLFPSNKSEKRGQRVGIYLEYVGMYSVQENIRRDIDKTISWISINSILMSRTLGYSRHSHIYIYI